MDLNHRFLQINIARSSHGPAQPPGTAKSPVLAESTNFGFMRETTLLLQKKKEFKRTKVESRAHPLRLLAPARAPLTPRSLLLPPLTPSLGASGDRKGMHHYRARVRGLTSPKEGSIEPEERSSPSKTARRRVSGKNRSNGTSGPNGVNGVNAVNAVNSVNAVNTANTLNLLDSLHTLNTLKTPNTLNTLNTLNTVSTLNTLNGVNAATKNTTLNPSTLPSLTPTLKTPIRDTLAKTPLREPVRDTLGKPPLREPKPMLVSPEKKVQTALAPPLVAHPAPYPGSPRGPPPRRLKKSQLIPAMPRSELDVFSRLYPGPTRPRKAPDYGVLKNQAPPRQTRKTSRSFGASDANTPEPETPRPRLPRVAPLRQLSATARTSPQTTLLAGVLRLFDRQLLDDSNDATVELRSPQNHTEVERPPPLSPYERGELARQKEIYYLPTRQATAASDHNYGFDDAGGNYVVAVGDHINYRYEICSTLGTGSFGTVVMARDHRVVAPPRYVAVKIIKNDLQWSLQLVKEIKTLKTLSSGDCPYILRYLDHFNFRSHMCIVTELLLVNLYLLMELTEFNGMLAEVIAPMARQLVAGVGYIHEHGVIHCDIKPENVMLQVGGGSTPGSDVVPEYTLKIIDFGTLCPQGQPLFTYIQLRYYRAPEVILGAQYSQAIDVWLVGCVLAELYAGTPLLAGRSEIEQCGLIVELLGCPKPATILNYRRQLLKSCQKLTLNFEGTLSEKAAKRTLLFKIFDAQGRLNQLIFGQYLANAQAHKRHFKPSARPLEVHLHCTRLSPFILFLSQIFIWDASDRATATALLDHPYVASF